MSLSCICIFTEMLSPSRILHTIVELWRPKAKLALKQMFSLIYITPDFATEISLIYNFNKFKNMFVESKHF